MSREVSTLGPMTALARRPSVEDVAPERAPTHASLERARRRQVLTMRSLRAVGLALLVLVEVTGALTAPRPGLGGHRLGVLLGLVGVALGLLGIQSAIPRARAALPVFLALLVASSLTLVWSQPNGPGFLMVFPVVVVAALGAPAWVGAAVVGGALVALAIVTGLVGGQSVSSVALDELGALAFYAVGLLARRLREGQEQAELLLAELEESRAAQAEAAALGERQRLAREVHDVLAHSLSGLVLQLEAARLMAVQREAGRELTEAVGRAHRLAKTGLDEARSAIGLLRDDELPGPERLGALAQSYVSDTGTPCTLEVSGAARALGAEARLAVYRVAQEALSNVRKHAKPQRVELHLCYQADGTRLSVEDFGPDGQAVAGDAGEGYGLTGMRERAELLGGELVASATATGFRVELWVPA